MQFCIECGKKVYENDQFCGNCGVVSSEKLHPCVKCKSNILLGAKFCTFCGCEQKPFEPSMFEYFLSYIKNPINFSGRAKRKEFIGFAMYTVVFALIVGILIGFISSTLNKNPEIFLKYFMGMYLLIWIVPCASAYCRRFRDIGMSFWWVIICFGPEYITQVITLINSDLASIFTIEHHYYSNGTTNKLALNLASTWGALWVLFLLIKKGK